MLGIPAHCTTLTPATHTLSVSPFLRGGGGVRETGRYSDPNEILCRETEIEMCFFLSQTICLSKVFMYHFSRWFSLSVHRKTLFKVSSSLWKRASCISRLVFDSTDRVNQVCLPLPLSLSFSSPPRCGVADRKLNQRHCKRRSGPVNLSLWHSREAFSSLCLCCVCVRVRVCVCVFVCEIK